VRVKKIIIPVLLTLGIIGGSVAPAMAATGHIQAAKVHPAVFVW
jgi:hypothetical protein